MIRHRVEESPRQCVQVVRGACIQTLVCVCARYKRYTVVCTPDDILQYAVCIDDCYVIVCVTYC